MTGAMIGQTRSWLRARSVLVPDDWLEACVEWIKEENQGNSLVQSRINELVFEQWLLADLHELGTRCLPNGLGEAAKHQLSGSYALQIDSMVDVGKSFYSQLQKVKGTENANAEVSAETSDQKPWEPKPSQMLMLNLTDGTSNVKGMEYRPLTCLNANLQPGTKVIVSGTVLCRRGVLFLNNNNLRVLGGEVDTLMEENTKLKVLQEALDSSMRNTGSMYKQEFADTDIKPSQLSVKNSVLAPNKGGSSTTINRHHAVSGGITRPNTSIKPTSSDLTLDEWDEEDIAMEDLMDELDDMEMPETGRDSTLPGQSSVKANTCRNVNMSSAASLQQNRNSSVQSSGRLYSSGCVKQERVSLTNDNENVTLRKLISNSRAGGRNSPEELPNRKRQKLSDSSSACVKASTVQSNYDAMFNDDFDDDFDDFGDVSIIPKKCSSNSNTISKPMVKSSKMFGNSVVENAGEEVKKLMSPLDSNSKNANSGPVGIGIRKSGKKNLLSSSYGVSLVESAVNLPVKLELPSSVSMVSSSSAERQIIGSQNTLDQFVRTPLTGQKENKSSISRSGNSAKSFDEQTKLTDFTLVKSSHVTDDN
ncbi:recQ-mediated genome instability protein 1-like isoform X2 [Ylistrum balloti]|uniref:recQ-mediated genome instability protein 1-like isoform X2 n=1 Tax=Ylistrum balloti TaxID=509963 RepID=UPI002905B1B4|nr:recQ-mediated genome instability protein 1-like isoform X2 [Ylistrum balloti]